MIKKNIAQEIAPYKDLFDICNDQEIQNLIREKNEILGFITLISAAPIEMELQDWLPFLASDGSLSFSDERLATDFAHAVLEYYNFCTEQYKNERELSLPTEYWIDDYNEVTDQGISFATGYLSAFNTFEDIWQSQESNKELNIEDLIQTIMLLLSKMATPNVTDPQMKELFSQMPDFKSILTLLPSILSKLGQNTHIS